MKPAFAIAALTAACVSTFAAAQMGPGMMHGRGAGPGMGQQQDCPMGQGMGPGMQGKGMMHGRGGHGMHGGQGMHGGRGMMGGGMGMMGGGMGQGSGLRALEALDLTAEQRVKVTEIRRDLQRRNHTLMGSLREIGWKAQDAKSGGLDVAAERKLYDERSAVRKQLFESQLEARAKAEAVLTNEQREQLRAQTRPLRGPRT